MTRRGSRFSGMCLAALGCTQGGATRDAGVDGAGGDGDAAACMSDDGCLLNGSAAWRAGCRTSTGTPSCVEVSHVLAGTAGSAATDVACSVRSTGAGAYRVSFRLATLEPGQRVDDSNESIAVAGTLPAVGQELAGADGSIVFRGFGFTITRATLGPSGTCHVFVDQVSGESLRGRFACADAPDDAVPPRSRSVRGLVPATASDDWGEFRFDHCDRE